MGGKPFYILAVVLTLTILGTIIAILRASARRDAYWPRHTTKPAISAGLASSRLLRGERQAMDSATAYKLVTDWARTERQIKVRF